MQRGSYKEFFVLRQSVTRFLFLQSPVQLVERGGMRKELKTSLEYVSVLSFRLMNENV